MWPFSKAPTKEELQGRKPVVVQGKRFVIRRVSPLVDFPPDRIPQIFQSYAPVKKPDLAKIAPELEAKRVRNDITAMLNAGVVEPKLVQPKPGSEKGHESGITAEDLMRDHGVAEELYIEILTHSLNRFKGIKGVFFSIKIRRQLYTLWRVAMLVNPAKSHSPQENLV